MAKATKGTEKTTKKTTVKKNEIPTVKPEVKTEEVKAPKSPKVEESGTIRIKMISTYIGNCFLFSGNVYDVDSKLAKELLRLKECGKC